MTTPTASTAFWIPFTNPIEIFPVSADGVIDYNGSYKAVCRQLTAEGMCVLQIEAAAPARVVIGIDCQVRVYFLPGNRVDVRQVGASVFEMQMQFTHSFNPKAPPPKIEFITEEEVEPWVRALQVRRTPEQEKRKHSRAVYHEAIAIGGVSPDHPAFALNISEGGIALIATAPLVKGEVYILTLPQPDGTSLLRPTRIVRCEPLIARFFDIGGQFVNE